MKYSVILHGLVVEWWIFILKVPGSNPVQSEENSNFGETFDFCYIFKKNYLLPQKTTASQTNFGFTNMKLKMLNFRAKALRKGQF